MEHPSKSIVFHRSWLSIMPQILFAVMVSAIVSWINLAMDFPSPSISIGDSVIYLPVALLVFLLLAARPLLLLFDCHHEITERSIRSVHGRVSLKKSVVEIPFEDLEGVKSSQTLIERMLGVGSVILWTSSPEEPALVMQGIFQPEWYVEYLGSKADRTIQKP